MLHSNSNYFLLCKIIALEAGYFVEWIKKVKLNIGLLYFLQLERVQIRMIQTRISIMLQIFSGSRTV
jgi:hypothetical protein